MKKIIFTGLLGSLLLFYSCGIGARKYNDTIALPSQEIATKSTELSTVSNKEDFEKLKNEIIEIVDKTLKDLEGLEDAYEGNTSFKKTAVNYYELTKSYLEDDLVNKIMSINWNPSIKEQLTEEDQEIFLEKTAELVESENALRAEQQKFSKENEIMIEN